MQCYSPTSNSMVLAPAADPRHSHPRPSSPFPPGGAILRHALRGLPLKRLFHQEVYVPRLQPGFTLVEMTIVLLIVSILIAGVLIPLSIQMEVRKYADTKKTMDDIREALIGFALTNGRLPCPADPTIADGAANAGVERATLHHCGHASRGHSLGDTQCPGNRRMGRTFQVSRYLSVRRRNRHHAHARYRDSCMHSSNNTNPGELRACAPGGDMKVQSRSATKVAYDVTNVRLPAVFISHGKNGYGAYGPQGTPCAGGAGRQCRRNNQRERSDGNIHQPR